MILRPGRCRRLNRGEDGAATVLAVAIIAALLCVTAAGAWLGCVVVARHRAQAGADLAALAGAAQVPQGASAACARAAAVARAMGVATAGCRVDGLDVIVEVQVPVAHAGTARASARAGPVG